MIARILVAVLSVITCALTALAEAQAPGSPAPAMLSQQAIVEDPGHAPIPIAVWAPAAGSAALIVITHGTSGNSDSHIDTAQALAQAGLVVVALIHPGDNFRDFSIVGKPEWFVDRSRQVSKAIDFMFTRWEGRARLIPNRVGVFGFSAGATTALISIGGVLDLNRVPAHCAERPEFVCNAMDPRLLAGDGSSPHWVRDDRIAAAVVIAPGFGFAFAPSGLANVSVPVQLWSGSEDHIVPYDSNTAVVRRLLPRAPDFHSAPGAGHYSFLRPCPPSNQSDICQDNAGFDRSAFHQQLNRSVIDFFRTHLTEIAKVGRP